MTDTLRALLITNGTNDGITHADTLQSDWSVTGPGSSDPDATMEDLADMLEACADESNDWGSSSSEAWGLAGREEAGIDSDDDCLERALYCEHYERAARARCAELAAEVRAGLAA